MTGLFSFRMLVGGTLALAIAGPALAEAEPPVEVADILSGIAHYTRWPQPATAMPIRICLQQPDAALAEALRQRLGPAEASVVVRPLEPDSPSSSPDCHIVYFRESPSAVWRPAIAALINRPVLTVGHGDDFCSYGGMFCLVRAAAGLRIRANLDSISRSGLHVNAQLLRLAQRGGGAR